MNMFLNKEVIRIQQRLKSLNLIKINTQKKKKKKRAHFVIYWFIFVNLHLNMWETILLVSSNKVSNKYNKHNYLWNFFCSEFLTLCFLLHKKQQQQKTKTNLIQCKNKPLKLQCFGLTWVKKKTTSHFILNKVAGVTLNIVILIVTL